MKSREVLLSGVAMLVAAAGPSTSAWAATTVQVGSSGKTFASSAVQCAVNPDGFSAPTVQAGLFNPKPATTAVVSLNSTVVDASVTATDPIADVWLATGNNTVVVALSKKVTDTYAFTVIEGMCSLPKGNWIGPDGLEYAASGKSYATVTPGCALNGKTGLTQPYVNLFDNGTFLLNVSVNGVPLTQLSATRPHTPVFLSAGTNVITAANGRLSTDYYVRNGGDGTCVLP
jgi:hypothetical protein